MYFLNKKQKFNDLKFWRPILYYYTRFPPKALGTTSERRILTHAHPCSGFQWCACASGKPCNRLRKIPAIGFRRPSFENRFFPFFRFIFFNSLFHYNARLVVERGPPALCNLPAYFPSTRSLNRYTVYLRSQFVWHGLQSVVVVSLSVETYLRSVNLHRSIVLERGEVKT